MLLSKGLVVELQGLGSWRGLNGARAVLVEWMPDLSCSMCLAESGMVIAVGYANLKEVAMGGGGLGGGGESSQVYTPQYAKSTRQIKCACAVGADKRPELLRTEVQLGRGDHHATA